MVLIIPICMTKFVEPKRIELLTSCLQSRRSTKLSYGPYKMGPRGIEPLTSSLSGTRSNQLSYGPVIWVSQWKPL